MDRNHVMKKILDWRDTYKTRFDQNMTNAFPKLEKRLEESVSNNWKILLGRPETFSKEFLLPEISEWVKQNVQPIIDEAAEELAKIEVIVIDIKKSHNKASDYGEIIDHTIDFEGKKPGSYGKDMGVPIISISLGVAAIATGLVYGVVTTTTTTLYFFTATSISVGWPLIMGSLAVGSILNTFGVFELATIKERILRKFLRIFIPKIRDAFIANGYSKGGKKFPSLKRQLQNWVDEQTKQMEDQAKLL